MSESKIKEDTIGDLYALRAGLSVIAKEKEIADGIEWAAESNVRDAKQRAKKSEREAKERIEQIQKSLDDVQREYDDCQGAISRGPSRTAKIFMGIRFALLILLCVADVLLLVWYFLGFGPLLSPDSAFWQTVYGKFFYIQGDDCLAYDPSWQWLTSPVALEFVTGGAFFGGIALIIATVFSGKNMVHRNRLLRAEKRELPSKILALDKKKIELKAAQADLERIVGESNNAIDKANKERKIAEAKATEHAQAGLAVIKALNESFGSLLDMRDWENLDIVIFSLETRRADSVKEALAIADNERRTNTIVESINQAAAQISRTLSIGFAGLQNTLVKGFALVSHQISAQTEAIAGLGAQMASQNSYLSTLTSQTAMNNALLEKSNMTSAELASAASSLRTYAELDYRRATT